ncbi:hypothetical protein B6V73_00065 [Thioclava sp. JM3]|uniref:helix-turn-helix domain-containing protein n=1 Tax=Thioclava sp. JM3 TaxID=1973004 RepID=UPI000B541E65|nr:helix-turn-helix domain-containing protein [Thioclava sp. JM3]OWY18250.1 hypothetical protein B6V73_00065 [Thioclava sp. JM3]
MSIKAMNWAMALRGVEMSPVQRLVLYVLCFHHNGKTGQCNPAMKRIGDEAGVTDRAAREAMRGLEHIGLVRSEKQTNEKGQAANNYVLFGRVVNKSGRNLRSGTGRNLRSGTGRNDNTATDAEFSGGTPVPPNRKGIDSDAGRDETFGKKGPDSGGQELSQVPADEAPLGAPHPETEAR